MIPALNLWLCFGEIFRLHHLYDFNVPMGTLERRAAARFEARMPTEVPMSPRVLLLQPESGGYLSDGETHIVPNSCSQI